MKRLQVKINNEWKYVFCRNELKRDPITTDKKQKALPASALEYFQNSYPSYEFKVVN